MKQKIFSLLVLLLTAVTGAWAAKDVVPSDAVLGDYYNQGDVCVCIFVPAEMNCNDIVLTGSFNNWSTDPANLLLFEPIEGYDGWYVTSFEPEAEPDSEKGMQAKPVMLQDDGTFNWEYQVGAATTIRGGVQVAQGTYAGEIDLINYGADAPNVFTVDAWKQNPCTASATNGYELSVGTNAHGTVKFYVDQNEVTTAQEGDSVKVVVTPATGWSVNKPAGQWIAAEAAARSAVPMLNGFELETVAGQENTYKFLMERANAEVSVSYKKLLTHQDISIEAIADLTYTGDSLKPTVVVKDGETTLKLGTHYTVEYANNLNAALATAAAAPTVTICAVDTSSVYAGDTAVTFNILKAAGSITYKEAELEKDLGDAAFTNELTHIGDGKVTYSIEGRNIATVDENTGRVTITDGPGFFTITATVEEGDNYTYETTTASYEVNVGVRVKMPFIFDDDDRIIVANKMALYTVLEKAREINRSQITVESNIALTKAMEDAEEALYKKDVTVEELQAAREALLKAIDEVKPKDDTTTGVSGMSGISGMSGGYYDLQGRKVTQPRKGIYIYKGKKVKK
jgi:hypothetical protein